MKNICEIKKLLIHYHQFIVIKHCVLKNLSVFWFNVEVNYSIHIIIDEFNISRESCNCIIEINFFDLSSVQNEFVCFCDVIKLIASNRIFELNRIFDSIFDESDSDFKFEKSSQIFKLNSSNRIESWSWIRNSIRKFVKNSSRFSCRNDSTAKTIKTLIKQ